MNIDELALKVGATHYSPAPMRAVKGWSFTFEQLQALIVEYEAAGSEPVAFYDGHKFYGNKESASMCCADMVNLKALYARPDPRVAELEAQNAALLVAIEAKNDLLRRIEYVEPSYLVGRVIGAVALCPSAELLDARDRKRDAELLRAVGEKVVTGYTSGELKALAFARESGEWKPEL